MNAQEQHTKKIGLNRNETRFIRLGLDSRPKHGQSSLSARFIRNATLHAGIGTLLDAGVNSLNSTGHVRTVLLMYPSRVPFSFLGRPRPRTHLDSRSFSAAVFSIPLFPSHLFHPAPRRWNRRATVYLNFRSKGNTRRMPRPGWTRSRLDEEDTGHPVNGNPRLRYS